MTFSIAHLSMGEFWSGSPTYSKEARSGLGNLTMGEFYSSSRTQAIWVRVGEYDVSHMLANKTPPLCCQMGALLNLFCYSFSEKNSINPAMLGNKTPPLCCQMGDMLNLFLFLLWKNSIKPAICSQTRPLPCAVRWGPCWIFFVIPSLKK